MITEDYVSFEIAKLLKEKGFDESCRAVYEEKVLRINTLCDYHNSELSSYVCAPTHQMAMKWLRKNGVITEVLHVTSKPVNDGWFYSYQKNNDSETNLIEYPSYEDAVEAALKYCLENLI